jgi:hypothetical protein
MFAEGKEAIPSQILRRVVFEMTSGINLGRNIAVN